MTDTEKLILDKANELCPTISNTWAKVNLLGWSEFEIINDLSQQRKERDMKIMREVVIRRIQDDFALYDDELMSYLN